MSSFTQIWMCTWDNHPLHDLHVNHIQSCQSHTEAEQPSYSSNGTVRPRTALHSFLCPRLERAFQILRSEIVMLCSGLIFSSIPCHEIYPKCFRVLQRRLHYYRTLECYFHELLCYLWEEIENISSGRVHMMFSLSTLFNDNCVNTKMTSVHYFGG